MSKKIHIAFATTTPATANKMLRSIVKHLPSYDISAGALLIGQNEILHRKSFCITTEIIGEYYDYLPIVDSRNLCQGYLQKKLNLEGGIGLILDDDLRWIMDESIFSMLVNQLKLVHCDMAFSSLAGDPPIPKEYTRASPLLDMLIAIRNSGHINKGINTFLNKVTITSDNEVNYKHHDIYTYKKSSFFPSDTDLSKIDWYEFFSNIVKGKTTTRPVITPTTISQATGRERGGSTIILNAEVLNNKNISLHSDKWVSRRSDMMMACAAYNTGFTLYLTPPIMKHVREESFDSHDVVKLIGDILGVSLVESSYIGSDLSRDFESILSNRINQTSFILSETSEILKLLYNYLDEESFLNKDIGDIINNIINENQYVITKLHHIKITEIVKAHSRFNNEIIIPQSYIVTDEQRKVQ